MEGKVTTVMKLCILVVMVLTGSLYSILLRYTRISSQEKYITTSAVAIQVSDIQEVLFLQQE